MLIYYILFFALVIMFNYVLLLISFYIWSWKLYLKFSYNLLLIYLYEFVLYRTYLFFYGYTYMMKLIIYLLMILIKMILMKYMVIMFVISFLDKTDSSSKEQCNFIKKNKFFGLLCRVCVLYL